jgi:hypothetical protein
MFGLQNNDIRIKDVAKSLGRVRLIKSGAKSVHHVKQTLTQHQNNSDDIIRRRCENTPFS